MTDHDIRIIEDETDNEITFDEDDGSDIKIISTIENPDIKVVMELGEPEDQYKGKLYFSSEAARQLAELALTVVPANQTQGSTHEFGFFVLGKRALDSFVATEIVPVDSSAPTGVGEKNFTSEAFAKIAADADNKGLEVVGRGHDHHNVASPAPSGIDKDVFSHSCGISRVELIISRTTKPISVSAYYIDENLQWNQMGGIQIVDDQILWISGLWQSKQIFSREGMSVKDNLKAVEENLAYYDSRTGRCIFQGESGQKVSRPFNEMQRRSNLPENILKIEV